jgi:predicted NAD/FAD-binding protein
LPTTARNARGFAMKVAIVGSGVSGLAAAHGLHGQAELTLFEAADHFGGHAHTVDISLPGPDGRRVDHGVDTGFLVYNERTYPQLTRLLRALDVDTAASDMSFSVQVPRAFGSRSLEWSGSSLGSVFAQRSNLLRPRFLRMLADLLRFNRLATALAQGADHDAQLLQPLGDFLDAQRFSQEFIHWYLLPMLGCIWSCPTGQMLRFPVRTMVRFCHNHGLLQIADRPQWRTVHGGSRHYVIKLAARVSDRRLRCPVLQVRRDHAGVQLRTAAGWERFDKLVLAVHSQQALALLAEPSAAEEGVLGAIRTQHNLAVLHTDASVLPSNGRAWAAWNYERGPGTAADAGVCLHYLINRLQPLPWVQPVVVSLNPVRPIERQRVLGEYTYAHPVFDLAAIEAQRRLPQLQGLRHTYYCGAWTGYGFHEDGLSAGLAAARLLLADTVRDPRRVPEGVT